MSGHDVTAKARRELVMRARRYGYFRTDRGLWLTCPTCNERVETDYYPHAGTITRQLDAMMNAHYLDSAYNEQVTR